MIALPPPLLPFGEAAARAEEARDATGKSKRLFELGAALPRYGVALALALLRATAGDGPAPADVANELRKAARLSDGGWFALARKASGALPKDAARLFAFARSGEATRLVEARNQFIHYGTSGEEAPALAEALLGKARELLEIPLVETDQGLVARAAGVEVPLDPWLPRVDGEHAMIDAPHTAGAAWRAWLVRSGEHRAAPALDAAVRALAGAGGERPIAPTARPPLVGHEAAIATLQKLATEAVAGGVRLAILRGQVGIGRSRLTSTLVESAQALGFGLVLESACSAHRRGAFSALSRALDETEPSEATDELLDAVDKARSPLLAENPAGRAAALEAIEEALLRASRAAPLLWVLDDAQWIDERSLALVQLLADRAARRTRGKLLVVLSMRLGGVPFSIETLLAHPSVVGGNGAALVRLSRLDDARSRRLVEGVAPLSGEVIARVVESANGVPHFLVQPILSWHEAGALAWREGKWHAPPDVLAKPVPGAKELLAARVSSFFEESSAAANAASDVIAIVAIPGGFVPHARLVRAAEASGLDRELVLRVLDVLVEAQILDTAGDAGDLRAYGFSQRLVRDAALASVDRPSASRVHRALLDTIAAEPTAGADAVMLGRGYARLGERSLARRWLKTGIDASLADGSFALAAELIDELEPMVETDDERFDLALARAEGLLRAGTPKLAREALARAAPASPRAELRTRIAAARVRDALRERDPAEDLSLVGAADADGDATARVDARLAVARLVGGEQGMALADQAVELARSADAARRYRSLVVRAGVAYAQPARDVATMQKDLDEARAIATAAGIAWLALEAEMDLAAVFAEKDAGQALLRYRELEGRARAAGLSRLARLALVNATALELRTKDFAGAQQHARDLAQRARDAGDDAVLGAACGFLADALAKGGGDLEEAQRAADEAVAIKRASGDRALSLALLRSAQVASARGDRDRSKTTAREAVEAARAVPYLDLAEQAALWLALARAKDGEPGAKDDLRDAIAKVDAMGAAARAPTKELRDEARRFLDIS